MEPEAPTHGLALERFRHYLLLLARVHLGGRLQAKLDQPKLRTDMLNSARYLKAHELSNGKLGATGFCWGGGTTNFLAVTLGGDLQAAVPYYGIAAETASVPSMIAFATSLTSARVGTGFWIIDSIIWVAVMTTRL